MSDNSKGMRRIQVTMRNELYDEIQSRVDEMGGGRVQTFIIFALNSYLGRWKSRKQARVKKGIEKAPTEKQAADAALKEFAKIKKEDVDRELMAEDLAQKPDFYIQELLDAGVDLFVTVDEINAVRKERGEDGFVPQG